MNGTAQQNCVARSAGWARRGSRQKRERVLTRRGTLLCPASQLRRTLYGRSSENTPTKQLDEYRKEKILPQSSSLTSCRLRHRDPHFTCRPGARDGTTVRYGGWLP